MKTKALAPRVGGGASLISSAARGRLAQSSSTWGRQYIVFPDLTVSDSQNLPSAHPVSETTYYHINPIILTVSDFGNLRFRPVSETAYLLITLAITETLKRVSLFDENVVKAGI